MLRRLSESTRLTHSSRKKKKAILMMLTISRNKKMKKVMKTLIMEEIHLSRINLNLQIKRADQKKLIKIVLIT